MPFLKDSLFLISCCRNEQSCMQFLGLRSWERVTWLVPLVTPFSDSLQWPHGIVICSVMWTCNAFWPFEDGYLHGFVFAQFFFTAWSCLVWWYINMLFCKQSTLVSLETWVPCIPLLINSSPQVLVYKDHDRVIENLKIMCVCVCVCVCVYLYLNNDNSKNISRNFSGAVVGSVGSVQFQIVPWSSLYFSRSIGPFQCSRC